MHIRAIGSTLHARPTDSPNDGFLLKWSCSDHALRSYAGLNKSFLCLLAASEHIPTQSPRRRRSRLPVCFHQDQLKQSLRKDTVVGIPMAPEVGLFLVKCLFENYNKRYASTHDPVDSDLYLDAVRAMRHKCCITSPRNIISRRSGTSLTRGVSVYLHNYHRLPRIPLPAKRIQGGQRVPSHREEGGGR